MKNSRKPLNNDPETTSAADMFRALEFAHYAERFRDKIFVIGIAAETPFQNLLLDLKVLAGYGIQVALVLPDPAIQMESLIVQSNKRGTRFHLSMLTDVLFQSNGQPLNLDFGRIQAVLGKGKTPVIAFHTDLPDTGELSHTFLLAGEVALRLKADKLFLAGAGLEPLIGPYAGSHVLASEMDELQQRLPAGDARAYAALFGFIQEQLARGIPDIVLIEDKSSHLFREVFTHDGAGILFNQVERSRVRQAQTRDVTDIGLLLKGEIEEGRLLPVDENEIESEVAAYWVYEIDGLLVGTARLKDYGKFAELAQFATLPRYRGKGRARELAQRLLEEAAERKIKSLFALSTDKRMWRFFQSLGFTEVERSKLPQEWRDRYDMTRPSRSFLMEL
ncbi:MAG: GNAT family N-acetyltransferase [SAR324 cluster bacterium]|nr:GNAT family N-acetyltransferase [SAR324 cluster bacterium]